MMDVRGIMDPSREIPVEAVFLRAEVKRFTSGEVACVTSAPDGWHVYLRNTEGTTELQLQTWAGLPVNYTVLPRAAA